MSTNDRRGPQSLPTSAPPPVSSSDESRDDEAAPGLDLDDPLNEFDRVTVVPDLPSELYAKRVMASVEEGRVPELSSEPPPALSVHPLEAAPSFDTAPPLGPRSADSTAPRKALSAQDVPTARPAAGSAEAQAAEAAVAAAAAATTARPPYPPTPTGLELANLSLDSISSLRAEPAHAALTKGRDSRDPVLEVDGLLSDPGARSVQDDPAITEMKDRYAMGDFSGALVIAEGILDANPEDLEAPRYAQSCREVLTQMYSARLGSLDQFVRVAVPSDQIRWLTLDHRAGFLLSLMDGGSTVDQILDISGMTRLDALRIMYQLLDQRVISLGS